VLVKGRGKRYGKRWGNSVVGNLYLSRLEQDKPKFVKRNTFPVVTVRIHEAVFFIIITQNKVDQVSFITGARSVDKRDFSTNMKFFGVPEDSISSIYSKLAMRTFDVYANIFKCMYSTRFNGGATRSETSSDPQPTPCVVTSLTNPINTLPQSDKYKRRKKESPKERDK
jgi:hypothetical protein